MPTIPLPTRQRMVKPAAGARLDHAHQASRGMVASFDFLERGGLRADGLVGALYGTRGSTVKDTGSPAGGGLNFPNDATNGFITCGASEVLNNLSGAFTVTALVRRAATGANQAIFYNGTWSVIYNSSNQIDLLVPGVADHLSTATVADTNWHHIAVSKRDHNTTAIRFYIDGVFSNTRNPSGAVGAWVGLQTPQVGKENGFAIPMNGDIAYVHVWNRALSHAEILADRNAPFAHLVAGDGARRRYFGATLGTATATIAGTLAAVSGALTVSQSNAERITATLDATATIAATLDVTATISATVDVTATITDTV